MSEQFKTFLMIFYAIDVNAEYKRYRSFNHNFDIGVYFCYNICEKIK